MAKDVGAALGKPINTAQATVVSNKALSSAVSERWSVNAGGKVFFFDADARFLVFADLDAQTALSRSSGGERRVANKAITQAVAHKRCREIAKRLGLRFAAARSIALPEGQILVENGVASVMLEDRPGGMPTYGVGNHANFTMDPRDGSVLSLEVATGWTYGPSKAVISRAAAKSAAEKAGRNIDSKLSLQYVVPGGTGGKAFLVKREARLAYTVSDSRGATFIDAITGAVIGDMELARQTTAKTWTGCLPGRGRQHGSGRRASRVREAINSGSALTGPMAARPSSSSRRTRCRRLSSTAMTGHQRGTFEDRGRRSQAVLGGRGAGQEG